MFGYDGRSMVADIAPAINLGLQLSEQKRQRKAQDEQQARLKQGEELYDTAMDDGMLDTQELIKLNKTHPKQAAFLYSLQQNQDTQKLTEIKNKAEQSFKEVTTFLSMDDESVRTMLIDKATQKQANGEDISEELELINMEPDQRTARFKNIQMKAGSFENLIKAGAIGQKEEAEDGRTTTQKEFDRFKQNNPDFKGNFIDYQREIKSSGATRITNNVGGSTPFEIPSGFMLKDPNDPSKGVTPIPGANTDKSVAGDAGKIQMLRTAQKAYEGVEALIFDDDGTLNNANLAAAFVNLPASKGRSINQKMEVGIQAITRIETGAAMPPAEVQNTRKRFQPVLGDSNEQARAKLALFKDFINGTVKLVDPSGRFNEERFQTELDKKVGAMQSSADQDLLKKYGIE